MSAWAAAITKPLAEEQAESALRSRGWRVYLPRYRKRIYPHGPERKHEIVSRPLFSRYVLMELQPQWSGVANVPGVVALVGGMVDDCWRPYMMEEREVHEWREVERLGIFDEVEPDTERRRDLQIGALVGVPELGGKLAELLELDEEGRARVLIEMMGRRLMPWVRSEGLVAA